MIAVETGCFSEVMSCGSWGGEVAVISSGGV